MPSTCRSAHGRRGHRVSRAKPTPPARRLRGIRRYERRWPEKTPLHKVVSENLESWLEWREAERPVPVYVEDELRGYLACGLLCFGFARALCTGCGQGFVVAFSCKGRGVCRRATAATWPRRPPTGSGRGRKSTRPGATGVVELTPFEFLDRLADLVPPPRKQRHRYHGVFAPSHKLRRAVTALAIGKIGKRRDAATGGHAGSTHAAEGWCDGHHKPRSHDTSRIAWAKLMARVGEEFPLECPRCGGDIRLRADGRQEPAYFEPEVRTRKKARMASPA